MTPLHALTSVVCPHVDLGKVAGIMATLLRYGADGSADDIHGKTPTDYATRRLVGVASVRAHAVAQESGQSAMMYRHGVAAADITAGQHAAALRRHRDMLRLLTWYRRRPALAALARFRAAATAARGGASSGTAAAVGSMAAVK